MLVIVESPSKCKTIEKYLGSEYKCVATYGHFREIKNLKSIQIKDGKYIPTYSLIEGKKIDALKKQIKSAKGILLATDNDREGEAIAWHICDYFNLPMETPRIIFNEITETCILRAIQQPTTINLNIVKAQQCRQMLDILLGYKISPLLWKHLSPDKSLSAGRCQTPTLRLIYDKYKSKQPTTTTFKVKGYFTSKNIPFESTIEEECVRTFLEHCANTTFTFTKSPIKIEHKSAPKPFTTASLLQSIPTITSSEIMKCCGVLYEQGYITYPRTNSTFYAKVFLVEMEKYIEKNHGKKYVSQTLSSLIQTHHPHEAIRVTDISLERINGTPKERRVYECIRQNTLESCMSSAIIHSFQARLSAPLNITLTHNVEMIAFDGWKTFVKKTDYEFIKNIPENTELHCKKMSSDFFINVENHYSESLLIHEMDRRGIGKPSTFASLVSKIQDRGYVLKKDIQSTEIEKTVYELDGTITEKKIKKKSEEKNKLQITHSGIMVIEFLIEYFDKLFDYEYTRQLEERLDEISNELTDNVDTVCEYADNIKHHISSMIVKKESKEIKIDDENKLVVGKRGSVILKKEEGETVYVKVKQDIDLDKLRNGEYSIEDIIDRSNSSFKGSFMEEEIHVKKGRYGVYTTWRGKNISLYYFKHLPIEKITLDNVIWAIKQNAQKYSFTF
jgi:DNA topoisomerase-1